MPATATPPTKDPYSAFSDPPIKAIADPEALAALLAEQEAAPEPPPVEPIGEEFVADLSRTLATGRSARYIVIRPDADPLHVACLRHLERLHAGGLIVPGAADAYAETTKLVNTLREKVALSPTTVK